jgi:hypothetical protein
MQMLTSFKVADFDDVQFISVEPKSDRDGVQMNDRLTGAPLYKVNLSVLDERNGRLVAESFDVTIPETGPGKSGLESLRPRSVVTLVNLRASMYSIDGNNGMSFKADRVVPATTPVPAAKAS